MRAGSPSSADVPTREAADHAVHFVIHGAGARVNVTTASASGSGSHEVMAEGTLVEVPRVEATWPALRAELAELGVPDDELDDLHAALLADGHPGDGGLGTAASGWLGRLSVKVSSGAVALAGTATTEAVTHVILRTLGLN